MDYEKVIAHVENESGIKRENFAAAKREEIRIFANATNVNGECVIDRFGGNSPPKGISNGDNTKRLIKNKLSLKIEDVEIKGNLVLKYKIIGIEKIYTSNTTIIPTNIKNSLREDRCRLLDTFHNCEIDHRYSYHLYENDDFAKNSVNYSKLHKVCQSVDRERRIRMKKTGEKYDNRKLGCNFHTVWGTSKYDVNEATYEQPSLGVWWEEPKRINLRDKELFLEYQKRLIGYTPERIISLVNKFTMNDLRIENIEEVVNKIKEEKENG